MNWEVVRAEYIGGGISQRKLAEKYGVSADVLMQKANREHWKQDRDKAVSMASAQIQQKAAKAISDNAATAQRIKTKLLRKLEKEIDDLPDAMGSESGGSNITFGKDDKGNRRKMVASKTYKLRDLTAAYRDLTEDMNLIANSEPVRIVIDV